MGQNTSRGLRVEVERMNPHAEWEAQLQQPVVFLLGEPRPVEEQ
jgi:hypothetical protein